MTSKLNDQEIQTALNTYRGAVKFGMLSDEHKTRAALESLIAQRLAERDRSIEHWRQAHAKAAVQSAEWRQILETAYRWMLECDAKEDVAAALRSKP